MEAWQPSCEAEGRVGTSRSRWIWSWSSPVCVSTFSRPCCFLPGYIGGLRCGLPAPQAWSESGVSVRLDTPAPARFGPVNARSLGNETYILKDFFISRELDFLFISEAWLSAGESSVFTELLPDECCSFNSGRGGGIATGFKSDVNCMPHQL